MTLKALLFTQTLNTDTSEDPQRQDSQNTRADAAQDKAGRSKYPSRRVQARSHLQAATFPTDLHDPTTNNAAAISFPKPVPAILFLKKSKPITQEQGYLDLLLTPSVTLKVPLFNSCLFTSQPYHK